MATVVVGAIVFGGIALAGYKTYKDRKAGVACGCGCSGCKNSAGCGKH